MTVDDQMMDVCVTWDSLAHLPDQQKLMHINTVRNRVMGSVREKDVVFQADVLSSLLSVVSCAEEDVDVRRCAVDVLASIAKGTQTHLSRLLTQGTVPKLVSCMASSSELSLVESCARCLSSIYASDVAPTNAIHEDESMLPALMRVLNWSVNTQRCVAFILSRSCLTEEHQLRLCDSGVIPQVLPLLFSKLESVHLPAIKLFTSLIGNNKRNVPLLLCVNVEPSIVDRMVQLLTPANCIKVQLAAANFLTQVCILGGLKTTDRIITHKVLPTLTRRIDSDSLRSSTNLRVEACRVLSQLIQLDGQLQRLACYSHQCLVALSHCMSNGKLRPPVELECAGLDVLAAITLTDEDIRRKVAAEMPYLIECVLSAFKTPDSPRALAAARIVHSMSRSVEQLRTTFQDKAICPALMHMLQSSNREAVCIASAALANLSIIFSPCRKEIVDSDIVRIFTEMALKEDPGLRLNAVWGLMNIAYGPDDKLKLKIVKALGAQELVDLLPDASVGSPLTIRLLGLVRNLLAMNQDVVGWNMHIDAVMSTHGTSIVQLVIYVLESDYTTDAKQMALTILANIAAGDHAKHFIMDNEDVLRKVSNYMTWNKPSLQVAATFCITNLIWNEDRGATGRRNRLKDMGLHKVLQSLSNTTDPTLDDRVKLATAHFHS